MPIKMVIWVMPPAMMPPAGELSRRLTSRRQLRPAESRSRSPAAATATDDHLHQPGPACPRRSASPAALGPIRQAIGQRDADQDDVEEHRREGRDGETAAASSACRIERDQRHEDEIGEHDAGERTVSVELLRDRRQARRQKSISHGMAIIARRVKATPQHEQHPKRFGEARRHRSAWRRSLAKSGTKAALNAPSANSRRNVLGMRKAAKKASATGPVPSAAAISTSRTKPSSRLISVPERSRARGSRW